MIITNKSKVLKIAWDTSDEVAGIIQHMAKKLHDDNNEDAVAEMIYFIYHSLASTIYKLMYALQKFGETYEIDKLDHEETLKVLISVLKDYMDVSKDLKKDFYD